MTALVCAVTACAAAIAGTWCARAFARRRGIVSHPNPIIPQHTEAVAYLGGVGVAIGIAAAMLAGWTLDHRSIAPLFVWLPALLFLALGVVDDLRPFTALQKLLLQSTVAALAAILGFRADVVGIPFVDAALGVAWIIALVNAVNVTDVCDGLVAGVSIPLFLGLAVLHRGFAPLTLAVAGACLGFLVFNRPPATIFLGDAGSHLLGFLAAVLSPLSTQQFPAALLIAGVFLFEMAFLIVVRTRKRLPWWKGSRDHFALRLQARGLSKAQTDFAAAGVGTLLAAMALGARELPVQGQVALLAGATLLVVLLGRLLLRWEVPQ